MDAFWVSDPLPAVEVARVGSDPQSVDGPKERKVLKGDGGTQGDELERDV